jgi:sugar lactone lactonase YvrE
MPVCRILALVSLFFGFEVPAFALDLYLSTDTTIYRITPNGTVSPFATSGGLNAPEGIAFDASGNLYAANNTIDTVSKITPGGVVSTFAQDSTLSNCEGVTFDTSGNLYVADQRTETISKITPGGVVSTFAHDGSFSLEGMAIDASGNLYVSNYGYSLIQKVTPGGVVSTFASGVTNPGGLAFDASGNLYASSLTGNLIYKITPAGVVSTFASSVGLNYPQGLAFDADGTLYVANALGGSVSKVDTHGNVTTFVSGIGGYPRYVAFAPPVASRAYALVSRFGTSGPGQLQNPNDIAIDGSGNRFVADQLNSRIVKFDYNGNYLSQFGGSGSASGKCNQPEGLAVDGSGYVFVADTYNHRVQKFDSNGNFIPSSFNINTSGQPGTNPGEFDYPIGVAVDSDGNVFVADTYNHRIQEFDNNGNYLAQFGTYGSNPGQFNYPEGLALDGNGHLFVAEWGNNRVQKLDTSGNSLAQYGPFNHPEGVAVDTHGNVFIADSYSHRIQMLDSGGNYVSQFGSGQLTYPGGIRVDNNGDVVATSWGSNQVVVFAQVPTTTATFAPNAGHTAGSLTLSVNDTLAAVDSTTYSLDGGAVGFYTNPIAINDTSLHIVLCQSTDDLGNQEDMQAFYFAAAPVALSLSPDHVVTGSGPTLLTLSGAGFDAACTVNLDGTPQPTTFIDVNNVQITLPNFSTAGSHRLTVADTHGHVSNTLILRVGKARLAVSATLSRDGSNNLVATLTFKNTGPLDATGVMLNTAILTNLTTSSSPVSPTSPALPLGVSTVTAGSSQTVTLTFPASVGTSGQTAQLVRSTAAPSA